MTPRVPMTRHEREESWRSRWVFFVLAFTVGGEELPFVVSALAASMLAVSALGGEEGVELRLLRMMWHLAADSKWQ